jgi:hypothetical protein
MRSAGFVLLCIAGVLAAMLPAQTGKTIIIRLRDGKTGQSLDPSNVHVRFNHQPESGGQWVDQKGDGTIEVRLPEGSKVIAVRATYANSLEYYVNCDVAKQRDTDGQTWYPVDDILNSGISAPNDCVRAKEAEKVKVEAKPGEFVLYLRKRNFKEQVVE